MPKTKAKKPEQALVRIDVIDKMILDKLAAATGESGPKLLHRAVMQLERDLLAKRLGQDFADIAADPEKARRYEQIASVFDGAVSDGLCQE